MLGLVPQKFHWLLEVGKVPRSRTGSQRLYWFPEVGLVPGGWMDSWRLSLV